MMSASVRRTGVSVTSRSLPPLDNPRKFH